MQENYLTISTAFSYLNGNHHLSFIAENASFYTAPFGTHNSLDYDMNAFATDTANFNYFENNGNISCSLFRIVDNRYIRLSITDN